MPATAKEFHTCQDSGWYKVHGGASAKGPWGMTSVVQLAQILPMDKRATDFAANITVT